MPQFAVIFHKTELYFLFLEFNHGTFTGHLRKIKAKLGRRTLNVIQAYANTYRETEDDMYNDNAYSLANNNTKVTRPPISPNKPKPPMNFDKPKPPISSDKPKVPRQASSDSFIYSVAGELPSPPVPNSPRPNARQSAPTSQPHRDITSSSNRKHTSMPDHRMSSSSGTGQSHVTVINVTNDGQGNVQSRQQKPKLTATYSEPVDTGVADVYSMPYNTGPANIVMKVKSPKGKAAPVAITPQEASSSSRAPDEYSYADPKNPNKWSLQHVALKKPEPLYASAEYDTVDISPDSKHPPKQIPG